MFPQQQQSTSYSKRDSEMSKDYQNWYTAFYHLKKPIAYFFVELVKQAFNFKILS